MNWIEKDKKIVWVVIAAVVLFLFAILKSEPEISELQEKTAGTKDRIDALYEYLNLKYELTEYTKTENVCGYKAVPK